MDKADQWLEDNPIADDNFTTDKEEAMRRGIYYKPICECGCGEPANYTLGARRKGRKTHDVASWDCRRRLRAAGVTRNTSMHSFVGMRFVVFQKDTGEIIPPPEMATS